MKTSILTLTKVSFVLVLVLICGTGFSQKSINYQSVGTNLEEITDFFDHTCQSWDILSSEIINDLESLKYKQSIEIIDKVTDWSVVHLKELDEAVRESKLWLSRQHFAPIKKSKHINKELAEKQKD